MHAGTPQAQSASFFKLRPYQWIGLGLIVCVHFLYWATGNEPIDISYSWQLATPENIARSPWLSLWYMHQGPPGISILYYFLQKPFPLGPIGFSAFMVGFHGLAYLLFSHAAALVFKHKAVPFITIIFFLNPVVATYFQYPFYCTYLFVAACAVLYFLARQTPALAAGTLLLAGILRTTFALPFGLALLVPFVGQVKKLRHWLIIGLCALPSLFWAVKNQYLFHQFGPSTWMGINLANGGYITYAQGQYPAINKPFDYDARPAAFINQKLDSAYNDVPYLHGPHFNNINTIYTSSYFSAEAKKQFSIGKTLYIMAFGVLQYLESPLDYPLLRPFAGGPKTGIRNSVFPFDYFNLPNIPIPVSGGLLDIHLSLYTFIYPLCFLFGLYYALKNRDYKLGTVLWLLLVVSGIYCSIDPSESNRMRMEIEPLWWWLVLTVLAYYTKRGTPTVA